MWSPAASEPELRPRSSASVCGPSSGSRCAAAGDCGSRSPDSGCPGAWASWGSCAAARPCWRRCPKSPPRPSSRCPRCRSRTACHWRRSSRCCRLENKGVSFSREIFRLGWFWGNETGGWGWFLVMWVGGKLILCSRIIECLYHRVIIRYIYILLFGCWVGCLMDNVILTDQGLMRYKIYAIKELIVQS